MTDQPAAGQTWQNRSQPHRTITLREVGPEWTRFLETGSPGLIKTRDLPRHWEPARPTA